MLKGFVNLVLFILLSTTIYGQDLTGTWEGSVRGAPYFKMEIIQTGDTCYGYKLDIGKKGIYKVNLEAVYDKYENTLAGTGIDFIDRSIEDDISFLSLQYIQKGNKEYLTGFVIPSNLSIELLFISGMPVELTKINNTTRIKKSTPPVEPEKDNIVNDPVQPLSYDSITSIKNSRTTTIIKTIVVKTDSVKIILKDDGEVDGDIVTVFDNGKVIVNKLLLTSNVYEITLSLPSDGSKHLLELVAENEGAVPPNTAYMLVIAGDERVEVKASSDKLSNAAIVFQRE